MTSCLLTPWLLLTSLVFPGLCIILPTSTGNVHVYNGVGTHTAVRGVTDLVGRASIREISRGRSKCSEISGFLHGDLVIVLLTDDFCHQVRGTLQIAISGESAQILVIDEGGSHTTGHRFRVNEYGVLTTYLKSALFDVFVERFIGNGVVTPDSIEILSFYHVPRWLAFLVGIATVFVFQFYCPQLLALLPQNSAAALKLQIIRLTADQPSNLKRNNAYSHKSPISASEFRRMMHVLTEFIVEYFEHPEIYNVSTDKHPGFLYRGGLPNAAPYKPESFEAIMHDVYLKIIPGITHWQHPRFMGYYGGAASYPDILGETMISTFGCTQFSWDGSPVFTELEVCMLNWVGKLLGLPPAFLYGGDNSEDSKGGGSIQDSATDGILLSLLAARRVVIQREKAGPLDLIKRDADTMPKTRYMAYSSTEAHNSINKACLVALVHHHTIEPDDKLSMRGAALEAAIKKDIARGYKPFFVMASLGTTASCAFDNVREVALVAKKYNMWVHVDAAYAGAFWCCPEFRFMTDGLSEVDSIDVNFHKAMLITPSGAFLWCRRQHDIHEALRVDAAYLRRRYTGVTDFRHWSFGLSRRTRALKIWLLLRLYGVRGLQDHSRNIVKNQQYLTKRLQTDKRIKVVTTPMLGLVTIRLNIDDIEESNDLTNKLGTFINDSHKLFVTCAKPGGVEVIRFVMAYHRCGEQETEETYQILSELIDEFSLLSSKPDKTTRFTEMPIIGRTDSTVTIRTAKSVLGAHASNTELQVADRRSPVLHGEV